MSETVWRSFEPVVVEMFWGMKECQSLSLLPLSTSFNLKEVDQSPGLRGTAGLKHSRRRYEARKKSTNPRLDPGLHQDGALQPRYEEVSSLTRGLCEKESRSVRLEERKGEGERKRRTCSLTPEKRSKMMAR